MNELDLSQFDILPPDAPDPSQGFDLSQFDILPPDAPSGPTLSPSVQESIEPTFFDKILNPSDERRQAGAKSLLGGGLNILNAGTFGFGDEGIAAAAAGLQKLQGKSDFQPAYDNYLNTARNTLREYRGEHPIASGVQSLPGAIGISKGVSAIEKSAAGFNIASGLTRAAAPAATPIAQSALPIATTIGGRLANAGRSAASAGLGYGKEIAKQGAIGAGYGAAYGFGEGEGGIENRLESAKDVGLIGGAVGGGLSALSQPVGTAARALPGIANRLELAGFGISKAQVKKGIKLAKDSGFDDAGELPIQDALKSFKAKGVSGYDADSLNSSLRTQIKEGEAQLGARIAEASSLQAEPIVPAFAKARAFVDKLGSTERAQGQQILADIETQFNQNPNVGAGELAAWQTEKVKLGQAISRSYGKGFQDNPLKTQILQKVRQDLRQTVEDAYGQLTGNPQGAAEVQALNKELGKRYMLEPVITNLQAGERTGDVIRGITSFQNTTGGFGVPLILGGAYGAYQGDPLGGALKGAAYGLGMKGLSSPTAKLALSDVLRGIGPGLGKAAQALPGVISRETSTLQNAEPMKGKPPSTPVIVPQEKSMSKEKFNVDAVVKKYSKQYDLPEKLIKAQVKKESAGKQDALSHKGAFGLLQLMPATAKEMAIELGETYDKNDPEQNVRLGTAYLAKLKKRYNNDLPLALAAYNWGLGHIDKAIAKYKTRDIEKLKLTPGFPEETKDYVDKLSRYLV